MSSSDILTIRGYVSALPGYPGRENAARIMLVAENGTTYLVRHKGPGVELEDNINAVVEVSARLAAGDSNAEADDDGEAKPQIIVTSYRLVDGFDDPWYDDAVG